jgi:hypothetical protein
MLTPRVLAAIRAALLFWMEEMAIHNPEVARPYWDTASFEPLSVSELESLRNQLTFVHYVAYDPVQGALTSTRLCTSADLDVAAVASSNWAAVLLPPT